MDGMNSKTAFVISCGRQEEMVQSATPKCKNCTLKEAAVREFLSQNPHATQKMIAEKIGKSEQTVKSLTKTLQEKNLLTRRNGKRNGVWEVQQ